LKVSVAGLCPERNVEKSNVEMVMCMLPMVMYIFIDIHLHVHLYLPLCEWNRFNVKYQINLKEVSILQYLSVTLLTLQD